MSSRLRAVGPSLHKPVFPRQQGWVGNSQPHPHPSFLGCGYGDDKGAKLLRGSALPDLYHGQARLLQWLKEVQGLISEALNRYHASSACLLPSPSCFPLLLPLFLMANLFLLLLFPTAVLFTQLTSYYISKGGSPSRGERDWLLPVALCLPFSYSFHRDVLLVANNSEARPSANTKSQSAW